MSRPIQPHERQRAPNEDMLLRRRALAAIAPLRRALAPKQAAAARLTGLASRHGDGPLLAEADTLAEEVETLLRDFEALRIGLPHGLAGSSEVADTLRAIERLASIIAATRRTISVRCGGQTPGTELNGHRHVSLP